jgi:hypothetical protein
MDAWQCLACDKLHPPDPEAREFSCADCATVGLGHPDGYALCRDCTRERLAALDEDGDVDEAMATWPLFEEATEGAQ